MRAARLGRTAAMGLALGMLLHGCKAVGPDYRLPASAVINDTRAQGRFTEGGIPGVDPAPPPPNWWRLYRDPVLDRLVERALAANTDLRIADANLERSQALLAEVRAAQLPDVSLNLGASWSQRSAEAYLHAGPVPAKPLYDVGASISYELDLFGRVRRAIEGSGAEAEAVEALRDAVRVNVVAETTRAYAEVCNAGGELEATRRSVALQDESLGLIRRMAEQGRNIQLDVSRQELQAEQLRAGVPALEARRINALLRLATLTGQPPAAFDPALLRCHVALQPAEPIPTGDGAGLIRRRPDLRAAERKLAAATARIGVATAGLYPTVQLGLSLGSTGAIPDFGNPLTDRYAAGPGISWHLIPTIPRARIAQANADAQAELARFDGAVLTALREVEMALNALAHDRERLARLEGARTHAVRLAAEARRLQLSGRLGAVPVLEADRAVALAEQAVAAGETALSADQVALFLALGGGWERDPEVLPPEGANGHGERTGPPLAEAPPRR